MDKELVDKLFTAFPHLYRNRYKGPMETLLCFGVETGNGWFDLIWELSDALEKEILKQPKDKRVYHTAMQVKEKYAQLRIYLTSYTDEMERLIDEAEEKSATICEICGKPGKIRGTGWLYTACDEHTKT
jgi:hypothetical protein